MRHASFFVWVFVVSFAYGISFRWLSVPLLCISTILWSRGCYRTAFAVSALFFISLLSPIDVMLIHNPMHCGIRGSGLRLVSLNYGMPRERQLKEQYDEWYEGGCSSPGNPPKWLVAWD
jgi:hypothetical protein